MQSIWVDVYRSGTGPSGTAVTAAVAIGSDSHIPTDRNGVPSLEGLRSWAAVRVSTLHDRASAMIDQLCFKVIEVRVIVKCIALLC